MNLRIVAACFGLAFLATLVGVTTTAAQEPTSADVSGAFRIAIPDNSRLRITSPRAEVCAEIPLGSSAVSYRAVIAPSATCQLSPRDALGFWLIYPNGAIELLAPATGQPAQWAPGVKLSFDLGRVPCPEPCRPPDVAGAPDPEFTLPRTGTGSDAGSWQPWIALVLLAVPAVSIALFALKRRRELA